MNNNDALQESIDTDDINIDINADINTDIDADMNNEKKPKSKKTIEKENKYRIVPIKNREEIEVDKLFANDQTIIVNMTPVLQNQVKKRDIKNTTWVDKYRPKTLNDIVGHDDIKDMLLYSIEKGNLPHLMFHGGSGTGKTSTALALVMQLYGPDKLKDKILELNASDENGINVVRDKIIKFANLVVGTSDPRYPSPPFKIIILDEADSMTSDAQTALKKVMESTCDITRFIFMCNYESDIIDAIKSRCADFRFKAIPNNLMIEKLKMIANNENMCIIDDNVYVSITDICEGDARRSINTLQNLKYIPKQLNDPITVQDVYEITSYIDDTYINPYWNTITESDINNITNIVTEILNSSYPLTFVLQRLKDKILHSKLIDKSKSEIFIHMAKIERMLTDGADNWIQLLSVLTYINSHFRKIVILKPEIY